MAFRPEPIAREKLVADAVEAMAFLRTCGSTNGSSQADAIQRLLSQFYVLDNESAYFNFTVSLP